MQLKFASTGLKLAGIRLNYLERLVIGSTPWKSQTPAGFPAGVEHCYSTNRQLDGSGKLFPLRR